MLRQALVQEGVLRVQEVGERAVLAQDVLEEQAGLGLHGVAQLRAPVGELLRVGLDDVEVAESPATVRRNCRRRRRSARSASMRFTCASRRRARSLPASASAEQFVVRHRTPQEVAQPRGQLDIARSGGLCRVGRVRDRARCGRGSAATPAWPASASWMPCSVVWPSAFAMATNLISEATSGLGHRAAVGAVRQSGDDLLHASRARIRVADQNLLAAGLLGLGREGTDEGDRVDELVLLAVVGSFSVRPS